MKRADLNSEEVEDTEEKIIVGFRAPLRQRERAAHRPQHLRKLCQRPLERGQLGARTPHPSPAAPPISVLCCLYPFWTRLPSHPTGTGDRRAAPAARDHQTPRLTLSTFTTSSRRAGCAAPFPPAVACTPSLARAHARDGLVSYMDRGSFSSKVVGWCARSCFVVPSRECIKNPRWLAALGSP